MSQLRAQSIPLSVVHLSLPQPTLEQVTGLLATRRERELQSVYFGLVTDSKVAAVAAELVCTDPHKQWTYRGSFSEFMGSAFCVAATHTHTASRCSSLTALDVRSCSRDPEWATLLASSPSSLRSFRLEFSDVINPPLTCVLPATSCDPCALSA
jgi:hypothetical protein